MSKKAIVIIASEETFQNLSPFKSIDGLNKDVRKHKELHHNKFTKNMFRILDHLHRYSAKYTGVSFLSKNNIAETLEISRRTVIRACKALEDLGVIKQYEMKRKSDMQQTANAIVIQPIEETVTQESTQNTVNCHASKTTTFSLKQKIKNINKRNNDVLDFDHTYTSDSVPSNFKNIVKKFFPQAKRIEEYHRMTKIAAYRFNQEDVTDIAIHVMLLSR
ncbi:helix-turn-helix domain-containing protein [Bacillus taeanensis]|uniref:Helix-turn-helix domain-containing protein n=1 Tax=Bacillus taeanensis TaxID=273032 RepID=A0A366XZ86_9BACI|nr:helix-turn-helix domain-containing protein [Bacillus taeanensis]RBW69463.1 helix-turn-helix domain-containing protein [Bacillus taeanensis]